MNINDGETLYLLSNFTHQVINPLNGVLGTLDNVIDGTVPDDRIETRLRSARGQLECTVSLVRNLAFFAQYTANYAKVAREKSDKVCIIPQVLIEAAQFFQEQGRETDLAFAGRILRSRFFSRHFQQLVHTLDGPGPSPTAEAKRLTEPARTPGRLVSIRKGWCFSFQ